MPRPPALTFVKDHYNDGSDGSPVGWSGHYEATPKTDPSLTSSVPPPGPRYHNYPFAGMEVGQSFFRLPLPGQTIKQLIIAIQHATCRGWRRTMTFQVRAATDEHGQPGVRCWRVS